MDVEIDSNRENKALGRKEISFKAGEEGATASRQEITKAVCKKLNLDPDATIVVSISQGFGSKGTAGIAHSYASREALERNEPKHLLARIAKKAAKAKPEEPKQEQQSG